MSLRRIFLLGGRDGTCFCRRGEIAGAVVVAGRDGHRSVRLGTRDVELADDERVVIRPA